MQQAATWMDEILTCGSYRRRNYFNLPVQKEQVHHPLCATPNVGDKHFKPDRWIQDQTRTLKRKKNECRWRNIRTQKETQICPTLRGCVGYQVLAFGQTIVTRTNGLPSAFRIFMRAQQRAQATLLSVRRGVCWKAGPRVVTSPPRVLGTPRQRNADWVACLTRSE